MGREGGRVKEKRAVGERERKLSHRQRRGEERKNERDEI